VRRKAIPALVYARLLEASGGVCPLCGCEMSVEVRSAREVASSDVFPVVDHIVALSRGGADDESNYRIICRLCNAKKGAR
jgi:5-methylcytosine-specific restriction endonuclease McrA